MLFATDVHGSEACFRKFLNAGPVYDTEYLVLGGDILGKLLVPIVREPDGTYATSYGDTKHAGLDERGKRELIETIRRFGHYPLVGTRDELAALDDPDEQDRAFRKAVYTSVTEWVTLAEERLRGTGRRCFMAPGNDDFLEIDSALQGSEIVEFAENRCLDLDGVHEMVTTGYSNPTPWSTERELPEDALKARIDGMASGVRDPANLVAVLHAPPHDSHLDYAPELDDDLNVTLQPGVGVVTVPVGSTAVRAFIEETQPLLSLHGHVHEGGGSTSIGRTLCINPGSAYTQGVLQAAIVEIADGAVLSHQFVSG